LLPHQPEVPVCGRADRWGAACLCVIRLKHRLARVRRDGDRGGVRRVGGLTYGVAMPEFGEVPRAHVAVAIGLAGAWVRRSRGARSAARGLFSRGS
jgi:hypothetical protein